MRESHERYTEGNLTKFPSYSIIYTFRVPFEVVFMVNPK